MPDEDDARKEQDRAKPESPAQRGGRKSARELAIPQGKDNQAGITEKGKRDRNTPADDRNEIIARATKINALATVAIFFANVVFAFFAWQQWRFTRDIEQTQLRPYVVAEAPSVPLLVVGDRPHITLTLQNIGQSPVYNEVHDTDVVILEPGYDLRSLPPLPCRRMDGRQPQLSYGKSATISARPSEPITSDDVESIKSGSRILIVVGAVCYQDIFKSSHETDFCFLWTGPEFREAQYCANGNYAD